MPWYEIEVYQTEGDDRVCPRCQKHKGKQYRKGEGPQPPLHPDCRCRREFLKRVWRSNEQERKRREKRKKRKERRKRERDKRKKRRGKLGVVQIEPLATLD
jgi:hypothetical protein